MRRFEGPIPVPLLRLETDPTKLDDGLGRLLKQITLLILQLLQTQDPQHWPTALYALVMLEIISLDLAALLDLQEISEPIQLALRTLDCIRQYLARYYFISTAGGRLLT